METDQISTQGLDHLGIVAGICQQINLIEQIDAWVGSIDRKVSVGQAVQAMVINALGFVSRPLYLMPEFYANKPLDRLLGPGIEANDLNDDSLGRALDELYRAGVTEVFAKVSAHALHVFGIETRFAHLDTTAFNLHGEYINGETADAANKYEGHEDKAVPIQITYGYSKDHRPDLKQAILAVICANQSSLPVWLATLSGNEADKSSFPEVAHAYLGQFSAADMPYLVADSALYGADNLKALEGVKWVTRVPATIKVAKDLLARLDLSQMQPAGIDGYFIHEAQVTYADIEQRWLVVLYEPRRERERAQLERLVAKEYQHAVKALQKLTRQIFACETDARTAAERLASIWKYHQLTELETTFTLQYAHPGRPHAGTPTKEHWQVSANIEVNELCLAEAYAPLGKYIIATNELHEERLPTTELLSIYKDQNRTSERGFRFLKDPLFLLRASFSKNPPGLWRC